jgi:hypothetical protein
MEVDMAYDALLVLRDGTTNLTATSNTSSVELKGTSLKGLVARLVVPQAAGTSPSLTAKVQESDDNSTFNDLVTFDTITAAGIYRERFITKKRYVRFSFTVSGTSPNFGGVIAQIGAHDTF